MLEQLITVAFEQGIWALLFLFMLNYVINTTKESDEKQAAREENYQNMIKTLMENYQELAQVKEMVAKIYEKVNSE